MDGYMSKWARDIVQWRGATWDVQGRRSNPHGFMALWFGEEMSQQKARRQRLGSSYRHIQGWDLAKRLVQEDSSSRVG